MQGDGPTPGGSEEHSAGNGPVPGSSQPAAAPGVGTRTCFHHTDRETGRTCTRCGRPACWECLHDAPVGAQCWECIRAGRPPTGERLRRWNANVGALVTKFLVAVNVGVFLFTGVTGGAVGRGAQLQTRLALYGPAVAHGDWYRLVTAGFVHYGLLHIAFNMVLLYQFGSMVENELGHTRFFALYTASLLAGSFGALVLTPNALTAGASGAVFGVLGAASVVLWRRGFSVWQSGLGALIVINLVLTFVVPGISIGGHLGGLVAGSATGWVMHRWRSVIGGVAFAALVAAAAVAGSLAVVGS